MNMQNLSIRRPGSVLRREPAECVLHDKSYQNGCSGTMYSHCGKASCPFYKPESEWMKRDMYYRDTKGCHASYETVRVARKATAMI